MMTAQSRIKKTEPSVTPPYLVRRLSRAIDRRSAVKLSPADLRIMLASGAIARLEIEAADKGVDPVRPPICRTCDPFIYFMQAVDGGPVKIGISKSPHARKVSHQSSSPLEYRFIALFRAPPEFERELHKFYRPEWIRGEWFVPSFRLIDYAETMGVCET